MGVSSCRWWHSGGVREEYLHLQVGPVATNTFLTTCLMPATAMGGSATVPGPGLAVTLMRW